jgi:hypothetical protein
VRLDSETKLTAAIFQEDVRIRSLDVLDTPVFAPDEIGERLSWFGAIVEKPNVVAGQLAAECRVSPEVASCVSKFVRASERTCDVAVEDMEQSCGSLAQAVAREGIQAGVLREIAKAVSGPRKSFVRFKVDRDRLLKGQLGRTGDEATDKFWQGLERKYPAKRKSD